MDNRTKGLIALIGVGVIAYTVGYHNGIRSMAREWSANTSADFATYLAARDVIGKIIKPDDDSTK